MTYSDIKGSGCSSIFALLLGYELNLACFICSGRNVHSRHPNQLPDDVRERKWRGCVASWSDSHPLLERMVSHRPGGCHTFRPAALRQRYGRGTNGRGLCLWCCVIDKSALISGDQDDYNMVGHSLRDMAEPNHSSWKHFPSWWLVSMESMVAVSSERGFTEFEFKTVQSWLRFWTISEGWLRYQSQLIPYPFHDCSISVLLQML